MKQWNNPENTNQYKANDVSKQYFLTCTPSYKQKRCVKKFIGIKIWE